MRRPEWLPWSAHHPGPHPRRKSHAPPGSFDPPLPHRRKARRVCLTPVAAARSGPGTHSERRLRPCDPSVCRSRPAPPIIGQSLARTGRRNCASSRHAIERRIDRGGANLLLLSVTDCDRWPLQPRLSHQSHRAWNVIPPPCSLALCWHRPGFALAPPFLLHTAMRLDELPCCSAGGADPIPYAARPRVRR